MKTPLRMPKLGLTMEEGTIAEWAIRPGDSFRTGQVLLTIETDKVAHDIEAEADGRLMEVACEAGETRAVGEVIGWYEATAAQAGRLPPEGAPAERRQVATPWARRLAARQGIRLADITGSGPGGRIRARDLPGPPVQPAARAATRPTAVHQAMARRLARAKQDVPHFYVAAEADAQPLLDLHAQLAADANTRVTLNEILVAAVGRALLRMPAMDRVWTDEGLILALEATDVGIAVHGSGGLFVPVVRGAGRLPLHALARQARDLVARARAGQLGQEDMSGGAVTVSNAGMHDITSLTPIINPGQSMIVGVGSVREIYRPKAGQPHLCREIGLVLACDHRIHDGVAAAGFLKLLRAVLAQPSQLLEAA